MAKSDYMPTEDAKLAVFLANFNEVCEQFSGMLELSAAELAEIVEVRTAFSEDLQNLEKAKALQKAATIQKDKARNRAHEMVRKFARDFKGNSNVPEAILMQLGVRTPSSSAPVTAVQQLTVVGLSNGTNILRFDRNGNSKQTNFIVEYGSSSRGPWMLAGVITRTQFSHEGNVPGQQLFYRVTAVRSGVKSVPTPAVVVYAEGDRTAPFAVAA